MRTVVGPIYWAVAGAMVGFGLIGLMTIGGPFLLAGAVMVLIGLLRMLRPALNPYCTQPGGPGGAVPADAGPIECGFVPGSYYAMFALFAVSALLGTALLLLLRRIGRRTAST